MTSVSIFSAPKPFVDSHVSTIQRNAIRSWNALGPQVEVLLIGDDPGIAEAATELGVRHMGSVERNDNGTPLINSIFELAQQGASHSLMTYVNADILLLDDFLPSLESVAGRFEQFLIVGQRWDLDQTRAVDFSNGWGDQVRARLRQDGRIHLPAGSDYFVFPRGLFRGLPPFALGRSGWDNWMIFAGRRMQVPVVDASGSITVVHQSHDYRHLEGGAPHYRLPESIENIRLGGGRETIFNLVDATWRMSDGNVTKVRWPGETVGRWAEAEIVVRLGPGRRLNLVRPLLHPVELMRRWGSGAVRWVRGLSGVNEGA